MSKSIPFKVSSRMIRMFGRQNVSNSLVAIIELIKNAYDADAKTVNVTFSNANTSVGTIIISDDGCGMDEEALSSRWMMIGTDYKEREPISPGGRVRTGAKGIGRFALDRLGGIGILETFQVDQEEGLRLTIDWSKYDDIDKSFESISHELISVPNSSRVHSTTITITDLRDHWNKDDYSSLYEDLVFLIPPLKSSDMDLKSSDMDFSINLQIDEYPELSGLVKPLLREEAEYELSSSINAEGLVRHVLRHRSGEEIIKELAWSQVDQQLKIFEVGAACGPIEAKLLFYLNDPKQIKNFDYKQADLQRYLKTFRGTRIYRDGFQIKPYGSKGNDWLELDARKHASLGGVGGKIGAYRVNNRQIIGTVTVSRQTNPGLEDRTSREGLIENSAYFDLKKFLMHGINFLEIERQYYVERNKTINENSLEKTIGNITAVVERIQSSPLASAENVSPSVLQEEPYQQKAVSSISNNQDLPFSSLDTQENLNISIANITKSPQRGKERIVNESDVDVLLKSVNELEAQLQETQLLRALATIGIALATFSHEIKNNVFFLMSEILILKDVVSVLPQENQEEVEASLDKAYASIQNIKNWSDFVLERTKKSRRTESIINFKDLTTAIFQSFRGSFTHYSIIEDVQIDENIPPFKAFPIDYEAILINFISNSLKALEGRESRHIRYRAIYLHERNELEMVFEDNGLGVDIQNLPHPHAGIRQIFEPFISGRREDGKSNDGTGMGLAVVRRIVDDLHGTIDPEAHGDLGGAKFTIRVPVRKAEN